MTTSAKTRLPTPPLKPMFGRIALIGIGLIGSSISLAARRPEGN